MMKQKHHFIFGIFLLLIFFASSCSQQQNTIEKGFLEGKISIGPLCPNYKGSDVDPKCQPNEETYKAWPISVWTTSKETKIAQIEPKSDGTYKIELPAGNYIIDLEKQQSFGVGKNNLPATVTINPGETTQLDVNIDTGIR